MQSFFQGAAKGLFIGSILALAHHHLTHSHRRKRCRPCPVHALRHALCSLDYCTCHCGERRSAASTQSSLLQTAPSAPAIDSKLPAVLVVGSINADVFLKVGQLPKPGETIGGDVDEDQVKPGGKGANQAVAARNLSENRAVKFVGSFGNDTHATWLKGKMQGYNVDYSLSGDAKVPSGQAYILLQPKDNSIIIVGAANQTWPDALTSAQEQAVASSGIVLLQREIPDRINLLVARAAAKHKVPVLLDIGGVDAPINEELLSLCWMIAPNETELGRISGMATATDDEIAAAVDAIQKRGANHVLVTLGTRGSRLFWRNAPSALAPATNDKDSKDSKLEEKKVTVYNQPCILAKKVVDTTGSGDCFRGSFAVAFVEGKPIQECLAFAAAAASLCVEVSGAMPSMPSLSSVQQRLSEWKSSNTASASK